MESRCIVIRKGLKEITKSLMFSNQLEGRLKSVSDMILRISDTKLNANYANELLTNCESFLASIQMSIRTDTEIKLSELEKNIIDLLTSDLRIPKYKAESYYSQAKASYGPTSTLELLLPKFLTLWIRDANLRDDYIYKADANINLRELFESFKIPFNHFVRHLADRYLSQDENGYNLNGLETFFQLFFGSMANYKFYVKAARILEGTEYKDQSKIGFKSKYRITLTVSNKNYQGSYGQVIAQGQNFTSSALGIDESDKFRNDGYILFGKHRRADISFPYDDTSIDYLACILVNGKENVYMIDTSKKSDCLIKIFENPVILEKDQIFNLSRSLTFLVEKINFFDRNRPSNDSDITNSYDYQNPQDSEITFSCIEGIFMNHKYKFSTVVANPKDKKCIFIFGCGTDNNAIDFFVPRETGASRKHMSLEYEFQNFKWSIQDQRSKNGTFILLKNQTQKHHNQCSNPQKLFENLNPDADSTIVIGNYMFYIQTFR